MSEPSKDLIKETEIGREAFDNKDPLMLLKGAKQTHSQIAVLERNKDFTKRNKFTTPETVSPDSIFSKL